MLPKGGHPFCLVRPRRYGKTTLLRRAPEAAEREKMATGAGRPPGRVLIGEIVVRLERGYDRLKGPIRRNVEQPVSELEHRARRSEAVGSW